MRSFLGNLHPLGNPEVLKKWMMYIFEKMTLAYFRRILKNGMFFQNALKKTPSPPPRPPTGAAGGARGAQGGGCPGGGGEDGVFSKLF